MCDLKIILDSKMTPKNLTSWACSILSRYISRSSRVGHLPLEKNQKIVFFGANDNRHLFIQDSRYLRKSLIGFFIS